MNKVAKALVRPVWRWGTVQAVGSSALRLQPMPRVRGPALLPGSVRRISSSESPLVEGGVSGEVLDGAVRAIEHGGEQAMGRFVRGLSPAAQEALHNYLNKQSTEGQNEGVNVTEGCFSKMDLDADGVISKWEFEAFLRERDGTRNDPPTRNQLISTALAAGVPFVGFGFMDNAIMIIAGETIEVKLGLVLGITTMASAAIGNLLSDVAGVGMGSYIEAVAKRLGFSDAQLSPEQLDMKETRYASSFGAALGVAIGCILGMFPLLLIDPGANDADHISYLVQEARLHSKQLNKEMEQLKNQHD